ncbi:MAG TPA: uroporphyrinogen decarboxylase family protein [Armatimonadota bacterium]|jgi:uroporphyrinogen decarboxylase
MEDLTPRERFLRAMRFEPVDRLPLLHMGLWQETEQRWLAEGMTELTAELAGFDGPLQSCWLYGPYQGPIPAFEPEIINRTAQYIDQRNELGQIERRSIGQTSMPFFLEYPVSSRADWDGYKRRLDATSPERYPDNWTTLVDERSTTAAGEIRGVAVWGYYGFPRQLCGPEQLSLLFYDDPDLIRDMNEYWLAFTMQRLERGLREMDFDYALIWEDNCYNHGMLHSPAVFREFMAPHYRTLIDFFRSHGIDMISVDSDGNVTELIPLLLDVGVTAIHPLEVAAGMDVVALGREYPQLQMWGGLDKRALAIDQQAIDDELARVIPAMKARGGYAAALDHNVPPDVSLANHRYYLQRLREISQY